VGLPVKLHTVMVTYNRLELTKQAIASYLETVAVPYTLWVVDNFSTDGTDRWLLDNYDYGLSLLAENHYPGYATNRGWSFAPDDATHLQRADNDFEFLPGWCDEVERVFRSEKIGQVGLRTGSEEENGQYNVGGNCVIRRELWDKGLRYDERSWPELCEKYGAGWTEDSLISPEVKKLGYTWARVQTPCIRGISTDDPADPYYVESWEARGIREWATDRHE
jgi:glycosyltransferase involved in cell wall biosynthesis